MHLFHVPVCHAEVSDAQEFPLGDFPYGKLNKM
jgi:hypothetical protein